MPTPAPTVTANALGHDSLVRVMWYPGYTYGDAYQHAKGKQMAARKLGVKTAKIRVVSVTVMDGDVGDPNDSARVVAVTYGVR